jgi:hypothetical protein
MILVPNTHFFPLHGVNGFVFLIYTHCVFYKEGTDDAVITDMKFRAKRANTMNIAVIWDVTPANLVDIYQRFGGTYLHHSQKEKKPSFIYTGAGDSSKTLGSCYFHVHVTPLILLS